MENKFDTFNEWLDYKIGVINDFKEDEDNIINIGNRQMSIKELKELESKHKVGMQDISKMNLLVFYDDILQYLGFGFIYYLSRINKDNDIFTPKEKKRLPSDIFKFFRRKDYDIFTMIQKMYKFPEEKMKELFSMYYKLYQWLMGLSPVSKLFNDFMKMGKVLNEYTIVFQFDFDGIDKYAHLVEKEIKSLTPSSKVKVKSVALNKKPRDKIYEAFLTQKADEGYVTFELEGFEYMNYIIDNNIKNTMLCVPRTHSGLSKEFINLSLYDDIISEDEEFGKINGTSIQIYDEFVSGFELDDANINIY